MKGIYTACMSILEMKHPNTVNTRPHQESFFFLFLGCSSTSSSLGLSSSILLGVSLSILSGLQVSSIFFIFLLGLQ